MLKHINRQIDRMAIKNNNLKEVIEVLQQSMPYTFMHSHLFL